MLRKSNTVPLPGGVRSDTNERFVNHDNEKHTKIKKQKDSQIKVVLFCLGIVSFFGVIITVRFHHFHTKYTPKNLRRNRSVQHRLAEKKDSNNKLLSSPLHHNDPSADTMMVSNSDVIPPHSIYNLELEDIHGNFVDLSTFQGMVTLVVNVACLWGKTKVSYTELVELQERYSSKGFSVLAFPLKDFNQELGSNEEIVSYVNENFPRVDFPLFSLSSLRESPVYRNIYKQQPDKKVKWNFYKYLVDWNGRVVKMYDNKVTPMELSSEIETLLNEANRIGRGGHKLVTA